MIRLIRSKIYLALFLMVLVLLSGILGYRFISNYTWIEALYMTIITITKVGFSEVWPLDTTSRLFAVILIISSVFILTFAISVVTEYMLNRNSLQLLKKKKVKNQINNLFKHVIVCGYGRNGMQSVARLKAYNKPFVVIEKDREIVDTYESEVFLLEGDANEDEVLKEAGIERANYLIAALPDDAANLFVALSARKLKMDLYIISRASRVTSRKKLRFAGADTVVMPDKIGGDHMAALDVMPNLITLMDKLSMEGGHTTNLEEVAIEDFKVGMDNSSLMVLDLHRKNRLYHYWVYRTHRKVYN